MKSFARKPKAHCCHLPLVVAVLTTPSVLASDFSSVQSLNAASPSWAQGSPERPMTDSEAGEGAGQLRLLGGKSENGRFHGIRQQRNDSYAFGAGQVTPMMVLIPAMPPPGWTVLTGFNSTMPLNSSMRSQSATRNHALPMKTMSSSSQQTSARGAPDVPSAGPVSMHPVLRRPQGPQRLSKGSNAALSMQVVAANLWQSELSTLTRRFGELRQGDDGGGLWARALGGKMDVDARENRAFDQSVSGAEFGADRALDQGDGTLYLGGMLGIDHSNQNFGEHSSGELDSHGVGFYVNYMREDGWYLDSVLKYDHLRGDVKVVPNQGAQVLSHYDCDAFGASLELGRTIALGQGWFVEPQLQLSAAHLQGPQYTSSDQFEVDGDAVDSDQARAGGRAGRNWQLESGAQVQGYFSSSWIDELAGDSAVKVNGSRVDNELPGSRTELGAGGSLLASTHQKVMVEALYAYGHEIEQPLALTVGYRYLWY